MSGSIRKVMAALVLLVALPSGQPLAQDRLKAGETLGAEVQRAVTCEEIQRALARLETVLTPIEVAPVRDAILAGRPECRGGEAR